MEDAEEEKIKNGWSRSGSKVEFFNMRENIEKQTNRNVKEK